MKAIKIDVIKKEVYEVEITADIRTFYKHLECDCFCQVGKRLPNGDMLLVDDNGLLIEEPLGVFEFGTYPQPLSGHGLMVGTSQSGETIPVKSTIEYVKSAVRFTGLRPLPEPKIEIHEIKNLEDFLNRRK